MTDLLDKLNEVDFGDVFQPAGKEELISKRGWALFNSERSEVVELKTYDDIQKYTDLREDRFKLLYRTGLNFYGVTDKENGDTFLVTVDLSNKLVVYDAKGDDVKYFME